jgi:regulator of CtrA degradation
LYRRVARLDLAQTDEEVSASPARSMLDRLAMAF